jgi:hypothetical protein
VKGRCNAKVKYPHGAMTIASRAMRVYSPYFICAMLVMILLAMLEYSPV